MIFQNVKGNESIKSRSFTKFNKKPDLLFAGLQIYNYSVLGCNNECSVCEM